VGEATKKQGRILVVDDEPSIVRLFVRALEAAGYEEVDGISDPTLVPAYLDAVMPDLVVLDLDMPGLDGFALLRDISGRLSQDTYLPVLTVSGRGDPDAKTKAFQAGAKDYLVKPVDLREFVLHVDALLETRFLSRRLHDTQEHLADLVGRATEELQQEITRGKQVQEALREAEQLLEEARQVAQLATWSMDVASGTVTWSKEFYDISGLDPDSPAPGFEDQADLWAPESFQRLRAALRRAVDEGEPYELTLDFVRPDGARRFALIRGVALRDEDGRVVRVAGTLQDITERWLAQESLRLSEERLRLALEASSQGTWELDVPTRVIELSEEFALLFGLEDGASRLGVDDFIESLHPDDRQSVATLLWACCLGDSPEFRAEFRRAAGTEAAEWFLAVGRVVTTDAQGRPLRILGTVADITQRKRAEERLAASLRRVRESEAAIIKALSSVTEVRDPYTAGHQQRVAEIAVAIARRLGLDEEEIASLEKAALLHDVGKISVPIEILSSPGLLTKLQRQLVEGHAAAGYELLRSIPSLEREAQAVLQHHERMDGSGYPQGLTGDEICLHARILAVADVAEAISSHRPYRPSKGLEAAIEELSKNRGRLYDPAAVDAYLAWCEEEPSECGPDPNQLRLLVSGPEERGEPGRLKT